MKFVTAVYEEIFGMFVDDGSLALLSLALVVIVGLLVKLSPLPLWWIGPLLVVGCLGILTESVLRAVRRR